MCEPCSYTQSPPPETTLSTPLCPQKRKLCAYLDTTTSPTSERESKILKTHHRPTTPPTFSDITPSWELDLSLGLSEFQTFGDQPYVQQSPSITEAHHELMCWLEEEDSCSLHGNSVHVRTETEVQVLEQEIFPGFTFLSLEAQLGHVADCLCFKFPHNDTVKLMKLFNLFNHDQQDIWNSLVCGNPILLNRLINRLRQSQSLPKSQFLSEFQTEGYHVLGLLARSSSGRDGISSQGGFRLIIDQIRQTDHVDVYRYCCFALGNLVTSMVEDAEGSIKQVIEQEHVIEMMLDM